MKATIEKIRRAIRIRKRLLAVQSQRLQQFKQFQKGAKPSGQRCPVCDYSISFEINFKRPEGVITKFACPHCEHLFSDFLQTDSTEANALFKFGSANEAMQTQTQLLKELVNKSRKSSGSFLDFGVGGNIQAFQDAQKLLPQHRFAGCDTYPSNTQGYFQTYGKDKPLGEFDGIASYAVVEHLTFPLEIWTLFNRLLKPMGHGGGIMMHAFPSQLHHDFDHWAIQIKTHVSLFSKKSLNLVCKKTGFLIEKANPPIPIGPHDHPVFIFRKIHDLQPN